MLPEDPAPNGLEGFFKFDPEDPIYAEHFPGAPVVPGSVIIQAFMLAAGKMFGGRKARTIRDFKFRKFVTPGEYRYRLEISESGLKCSLFIGNSVAASG